MNTHCRYCTQEFAKLGLSPRRNRVQCGSDACHEAYWRDQSGRYRKTRTTIRGALREQGMDHVTRAWGDVSIPDKQAPLTKDAMLVPLFCPGCGTAHTMPKEQRLECHQCHSVWTISWGTVDSKVVVARLDRWR